MSLYAIGITMTLDSGALVAIEKVQRKTGRQRDAWHYGAKTREDIYETVARIVGAEELSGPVPDMIDTIATRVHDGPMAGDNVARVDVSVTGAALLRLFRDRRLHPMPMILGGEKETTDKVGTVTLPVSTLQSVASLMFQQDRIELVEGLVEGPMLQHALRHLDTLPESGPARDLGIAAGIAVWTAYRHGSSSPWVSSKPAPKDLNEEWARKARSFALEQARKAATSRGRWWSVQRDSEDK